MDERRRFWDKGESACRVEAQALDGEWLAQGGWRSRDEAFRMWAELRALGVGDGRVRVIEQDGDSVIVWDRYSEREETYDPNNPEHQALRNSLT